MKNGILILLVFLTLNFTALFLGSMFTSGGAGSDWYMELAKAPWNPPGWAFGAAWTFIMLCFAPYMTIAWKTTTSHTTLSLAFSLQWILNVSWSPVFFYYRQIPAALLIIISLTIVIGAMLLLCWPRIKLWSLLLVPYLLWLIVATSLNTYILLMNRH